MKSIPKHIRVAVSGIILLIFICGFVFSGRIFGSALSFLASCQFFPSLLSALKAGKIEITLVAIVLVTLLFGRIYCSSICPLGTLQDCAGTFAKKNRRFRPQSILVRYLIPVILISAVFCGTTVLMRIFEPYSISFHSADILLAPFSFHVHKLRLGMPEVMLSGVFLLLLALLAFFKGRYYCNSICPTGAVLSLLSIKPVFSFRIDKTKCVSCKKCETSCKAGCIDASAKSIDTSRCVSCFSCLSACRLGAIRYGSKHKTVPSAGQNEKVNRHQVTRRNFIVLAIIGFLAYPLSRLFSSRSKKTPITPPGSKSLKNFTGACTSCHLCIEECPTGVLQPSFLQFGLTGFLLPHMDYSSGYCDYNCRICSDICPSGAIQSISIGEKQMISIGTASINETVCIPYAKGTSCAACDEVCPTGTILMVAGKNGLPAPKMTKGKCIGCGACEYACPVSPQKAIRVTPREIHERIAELPSRKKSDAEKTDNDFAF